MVTNKLSKEQIQIITDLVIDNGLIYTEAQHTLLIGDSLFILRLMVINDELNKLYLTSLQDNISIEHVLNKLDSLLEILDKYRRSYYNDNNKFKMFAYRFMNSFFDKTSETFYELMNTI